MAEGIGVFKCWCCRFRWDPGADMQTKKNLLRRATLLMQQEKDIGFIDYYVPFTKLLDRADGKF